MIKKILSLMLVGSMLLQAIVPVQAHDDVIHYDDVITNQVEATVDAPEVIVEESCQETGEHTHDCGHLTETLNTTGGDGVISTTIRFDYSDKITNILERTLYVTLIKNGEQLDKVELSNLNEVIAGYDLTITPKTALGEVVVGQEEVGQLFIEIKGLELGTYVLEFSGDYHVAYRTDEIELVDFAKHVHLGTANATFTYGDVGSDGKIDRNDLDIIKTSIINGEDIYDLNGDGVVNVTDLSIVSLAMSATGDAIMYDTFMIGLTNKIDTEHLHLSMSDLSIDGNIEQILTSGNDDLITITQQYGSEISESNPIVIPLVFSEEVEMSQIEIKTTDGEGAVQSGFVDVVYDEQGEEVTQRVYFGKDELIARVMSFDESVNPVTTEVSDNVVVINLGTRVVVKSITVTVEKVEGSDNSYVAIQEVTFVKDIVPEYPDASNALIHNINVVSGNKSLTLTWDKALNVGGYRVKYGTESNNLKYTKDTSVNSITLSGLENLTEYFITIEATSGTWTGTTSDQVVGIPQPSSKPGVPTSIEVEAMDSMLKIKWEAPLNADTYNVYIKETTQLDSEYVLVASNFTSTSYTIKELTNDTSYTFKLSASNIMGEGSKTAGIEATPKKPVIEDPILPVTDRIDNSNITKAWLSDSSNVNTSEMPNGFSTTHLYDEDYSTYWMAQNYSSNSGLNFTFKQGHDMSYMIYVPRLDGSSKTSYLNVNSFTVKVWAEGEDLSSGGTTVVSSQKSTYHLDVNGTPFYVIQFNQVFEDVVQLVVHANETTGAGRVNLSEAVFYDHSSLGQDVSDLFANDSFTEIKSTVTQAQITALETRIAATESYIINHAVLGEELKLAKALLNNEEDALGYVRTDIVSINNSNDDRALSNISPLGVVGLARVDLSIYADIPVGEKVYVYPSQYFANPGEFKGSAIELVQGRNIVTVEDLTNITGATEGGSFYYTYTGSKASEITLHILNYCGVYSGINTPKENIQIPTLELYDLGDLATANQTELRNRITEYMNYFETYTGKSVTNPTLNPSNATEISTSAVLLSVPANGVWNALGGTSTTIEQKVDTMINTLLAWDELIYVTHTVYGDEPGERQGRQNIRYMRMSATAFMYAAGDHIGIQYGSTSSVIGGKPTSLTGEGNANSLYGWGIAHEIGHNLDRQGVIEVTNNIYSMIAANWDGQDGSGLTTSRVPYQDVFDKVSVGAPGIPNNVFLQLGMYWQLHLAYSDENILEYFTAFNKAYKNGEFSNFSGYERTAIIASKISGKNLTEYFTAWGVTLSDEVKVEMAKYPTETRKIQYLTDSERVYRLEGNTGLQSVEDYTVNAEFDSENARSLNITINHSMDTAHLQGFEIYRDNECVGFTQTNTFVDSIGSYNNAAFTYSVQAIDKLGNVVGKQTFAKEVRIELDDIVSTSAYTVEEITDGFRYTFKEATNVSGLIIDNPSLSGKFTVSIISEVDGELGESIIAKNGDFTNNETLTGDKFKNYFKRPDANDDDTRIGIYEAKVIEVTGITSQQTVSFIASVEDNVSFYQPMMGILGHDFDTGDGILNKGDIIIIGEYIGDPYFNEIVLQGMFASSLTDEVGVEFIERPMAGTTYMFATVPEGGAVSVISDGLFIFKPDVQNESDLQGVDGTTCGGASILPAQIKAIMNRTSDTGTRQTSDTTWQHTPTYETLPTIVLQ